MTRMLQAFLAALVIGGAVLWFVSGSFSVAQEQDDSRVLRLIERQLSTPDRTVDFSGVRGLLSSNVEIDALTISDAQGPWLRFEEVLLSWNRSALLRRRLEVERLRAGRIQFIRPPQGPEQLEGAGSFELPLVIEVESIEAPRIEIGEAVAGRMAILSVEGEVVASAEGIDTRLQIQRLDRPGGSLAGRFLFDPARNVLVADADYNEPSDGLIANLLKLPGRPALSFALDGEGELSDWQGKIGLSADGSRVLDGDIRVVRSGGDYAITTDLEGSLEPLVADSYDAILAGRSRLSFALTIPQDRAVRIDDLKITSDQLSLSADIALTPDGFPRSVAVELQLDSQTGNAVGLPFAPGNTAARTISLSASLNPADGWRLTLDASGLEGDFGRATGLTLKGEGAARNLSDPNDRFVGLAVDGELRGFEAENPALAPALNGRATLAARGEWTSDNPLRLSSSNLSAGGVSVEFAGAVTARSAFGRYALSGRDLSRFSALAGRQLAGRGRIEAEGTIGFEGLAFDLDLDGQTTDLAVGIPGVDPLLTGVVDITGKVARGPQGWSFGDLRLDGPALQALLDGAYDEATVDVAFEALVKDLERLSNRASGALKIEGRATGMPKAPRLNAQLRGEGVTLDDRAFTSASAEFMGALSDGLLAGEATVNGVLEGVPLTAKARVAQTADKAWSLEDLSLQAGETNIKGQLTLLPDRRLDGSLMATSPDVSTIAPLFLLRASGALELFVDLTVVEGRQAAEVSARADNLTVEDIRIGRANIDLKGENLYAAPALQGSFSGENINVPGLVLRTVRGSAERRGDETRFEVDAALDDGEATLAGRLQPQDGAYMIALDRLDLARGGVAARLAGPAEVTLRDGDLFVDGATLLVGQGRLAIDGRIGRTLDLDVRIADLQAAVANTLRPSLEAAGIIDGSAKLEGTSTRPTGRFDLAWQGASIALLNDAGVPPLDIRATGDLTGEAANVDASITGPGGIRLVVDGQVPLSRQGPLDLTADLQSLPAAIVNSVAPQLGVAGIVTGSARLEGTLAQPRGTFDIDWRDASLRRLREAGVGALSVDASGRFEGTALILDAVVAGPAGARAAVSGRVPLQTGGAVDLNVDIARLPTALINALAPGAGLEGVATGTVRIRGSLSDPVAEFDLDGQGLSAAATRAAGLGSLAVDAEGRFENRRLTLTGRLREASGLDATISGGISFIGAPDLDLRVAGAIPLSLANRALGGRGTRLSGRLAADLRLRGSPSDPAITGTISTSDGALVDPLTGIVLSDLSLSVSLTGERAVIQRLTARSGRTGTLEGSGTISLDPQRGFPADIQIALDNVRYEDGSLLAATLGGRLSITGPVALQPTVSGQITVARAEVAVPERLAGGGLLLEVKHVRAPEAVLRTWRRVQPRARPLRDGGEPSGVLLDDLVIDAPARIFVRGRGLDVELGGRIRLNGPVSAVRASGGFELRRGRLDLLTRRITFERGRLDFVGDLDPFLDFSATTETGDITVTVTVTGRASDPMIEFSSDPELPDDEVLAQLLFGRGLDDLSPLQLVQLANAAATLGGLGQGEGLLGGLRRATGFDDLDIIVDENGGAAVRAGRYLNENIYLGVQQGTTSESSRVTIDLDITKSVKARGELGADGDSSIGLYYEREY